MSTPTAVADAELAKVLSDNEDYILSVSKSKAVDLCKEMFQRCVISDSMYDQFSSLDHDTVEPRLQLRYLIRLVMQRLLQDKSVGDKFLSLLESSEEHWLCEYLRGNSSEPIKADEVGLDKSLTTSDISVVLELLVEVSPEWEMLGIALGLSPYQIRNIKGDNNMKNLWNVLEIWLSGVCSVSPTINSLAQALRSKTVNHGRLAEKIEAKFRSSETSKHVSSINITDTSKLALTITYQSFREVEVKDGKSTLLLVQANHKENVSYQWSRNDQPLANSHSYYGVYDNILYINHAHQGMVGDYTCCVRHEKREIVSNKVTLKVLYPPEKKALLDLYSVNAQVPLDDAWPPVGTQSFINLVLIKSSQQHVDASSYSPNRVSEITGKIKFGDVFRAYKSKALILIEGRPGSGKTTLVQKIIKDWAEGTALDQAQLVFLVPLRSLLNSASPNDTLFAILQQLYTNAVANLKTLISDIERRNGEGVCFVLDGLDEYNPLVKDKSVIFKLLHKSYLLRAMIIVTSRPAAMARLKQTFVTQHIEVVGFTKNQISEYIDEFQFDTYSDSFGPAKLKEYLRLHSNVLDMCYLPIHAAIICFVYQTNRGHLPHTQTKIYNEFTKSMILRHLKRHNIEIQLFSLKELPDDTCDSFNKLCLLAFNMTVESKQVINARDITFSLSDNTSPCGDWSLGLVTCNRTAQLCGISTSYMFLHLTLQEYLAAYYVANTRGEEKKQLIERLKLSKFSVHNVLTFCFGLEVFESQNELDVYHEVSQTFSLHGLDCIKFAFESQQHIVCDEMVRLLGGKIKQMFRIGLTYRSDAFVYVICNTTQPITELVVHDVRDPEGILPQIQHVKFPELESLYIAFFTNENTLQDVFLILKSCAQLRRLELNILILTAQVGGYLADKFTYLSNLVHLKLESFISHYSIDISGLLAIINQLHCLIHIKILDLSGFEMDIHCCIVLASKISRLINIEKLCLSESGICSEGAIALCSSLQHLTNLKILNLSANEIGSDGAICLASKLHHFVKLEDLDLFWNNLNAQSAIQIIIALKDCRKLTCVRLSNNTVDQYVGFSSNYIIERVSDGFELLDLVASSDSATIDKLVAAARLHERDVDLHLGFKTIHVSLNDRL